MTKQHLLLQLKDYMVQAAAKYKGKKFDLQSHSFPIAPDLEARLEFGSITAAGTPPRNPPYVVTFGFYGEGVKKSEVDIDEEGESYADMEEDGSIDMILADISQWIDYWGFNRILTESTTKQQRIIQIKKLSALIEKKTGKRIVFEDFATGNVRPKGNGSSVTFMTTDTPPKKVSGKVMKFTNDRYCVVKGEDGFEYVIEPGRILDIRNFHNDMSEAKKSKLKKIKEAVALLEKKTGTKVVFKEADDFDSSGEFEDDMNMDLGNSKMEQGNKKVSSAQKLNSEMEELINTIRSRKNIDKALKLAYSIQKGINELTNSETQGLEEDVKMTVDQITQKPDLLKTISDDNVNVDIVDDNDYKKNVNSGSNSISATSTI